MWLINVQLGKYFDTPPVINSIFGLLSFITVPTGLLAANHLSQRDESDLEERLRQERRDDKLKKVALKSGINVFAHNQLVAQPVRVKRSKAASHFKDQMVKHLDTVWANERRVAKGVELSDKFNLDYHSSKGFISGLRLKWKRDHNVGGSDQPAEHLEHLE
jgi:hypothetical protein